MIDEEDEPTQAYFSSYIALRKNTMNTQHLFSGAATGSMLLLGEEAPTSTTHQHFLAPFSIVSRS
jgi:hypothetical protein